MWRRELCKGRRTVIVVFAIFAALGSMLYVNPVKAATLNVGPNQQYTKIQDAVDAAGPNDTIIVDPSTYSEYVTINPTKSGLILMGAGAGATILDGTSLPPAWPSSHGIWIWGADSVTITGFTIRNFQYGAGVFIGGEWVGYAQDGTPLGDYGSGWNYAQQNTVEYNVIEHSGISGVVMASATYSIIDHNTIRYNDWHGIMVDSGYYNSITWNTIDSNYYTGIELHIAGYAYVYRNTVTNTNVGWGLYADGYSGGLTIDSNGFNDNGYGGQTSWGIYGGGLFVISGANNIIGNTANNNKGDGILILQGSGNWIWDNNAPGWSGANKANGNGRHGIAVGHSILPAYSNMITKNIAKNNGWDFLNQGPGYDLYDGAGSGGSTWNTWTNNNYNTKNNPSIN